MIKLREQRKHIAQETLQILGQGFYTALSGKRVDISGLQNFSELNSRLITPERGRLLVKPLTVAADDHCATCEVVNESTVRSIVNSAHSGETVAALNFASAKNPGGGFLGGSMAQEEALAYSSGLYKTQLRHLAYYEKNRAYGSMTYTDHAIYSPFVPFFRDEGLTLLETPVACSILTLPAVNIGQVYEKGENAAKAKQIMKDRMRIALAILAYEKNSTIILGAFGCGVFGNDPKDVARWWRELLIDEKYNRFFGRVLFAVLDKPNGPNIKAFEDVFGRLNK